MGNVDRSASKSADSPTDYLCGSSRKKRAEEVANPVDFPKLMAANRRCFFFASSPSRHGE